MRRLLVKKHHVIAIAFVTVQCSFVMRVLRIMHCGRCEVRPTLYLRHLQSTQIEFVMANPERKVALPVDGSEHSEKACDCTYLKHILAYLGPVLFKVATNT